MAGVQQFRLA